MTASLRLIFVFYFHANKNSNSSKLISVSCPKYFYRDDLAFAIDLVDRIGTPLCALACGLRNFAYTQLQKRQQPWHASVCFGLLPTHFFVHATIKKMYTQQQKRQQPRHASVLLRPAAYAFLMGQTQCVNKKGRSLGTPRCALACGLRILIKHSVLLRP